MDDVAKTAVISDDGKYRYQLSRIWDEACNPLPIIMLNPSTADHEVDDPTILKCMKYARRDGFGGIIVVNLFALRATRPAALRLEADPVGPENDLRIMDVFDASTRFGVPVLCGWGADDFAAARGEAVLQRAAHMGVDLRCLAVTKFGAPKHPLYCLDAQPLVPYGLNPAAEAE